MNVKERLSGLGTFLIVGAFLFVLFMSVSVFFYGAYWASTNLLLGLRFYLKSCSDWVCLSSSHWPFLRPPVGLQAERFLLRPIFSE